MKKQMTLAIGLLTLSALLAGCSSNSSAQEPIVSEEQTTLEILDESTSSENIKEPQEEVPVETPEAESEDLKEEETEKDSQDAASKEELTEKVEATDKIPPKKEENNSASKPQTPSKPVTNSPSKPQASTKPNTTQKPKPTPTPAPSPKPEASPAPVQPESTPDNNDSVQPDTTSLSCAAIFNQITSGMDTSNHMAMDSTLLADFYGMDTDLLEDFCVQVPMMSYSITEVGVFKVKDVNNVSSVVSAINKRANDIGIMLYPSLEEIYAAKQIVTKGQYILFVISDDADSIVANFNALV